jgi:phosphatidylinositol-4-phosphate 3-kinase
MAYVINGGDKPTAKFHHFVDMCCTAFNVVRRHGSLLLNLFGLVRAEITFYVNTATYYFIVL